MSHECVQGRIQDFKLGGGGGGGGGAAYLKKFAPSRGWGAKIFEVIRVKNHDFTPKNHIFSNFRGGGGRTRRAPPWIRPWYTCIKVIV